MTRRVVIVGAGIAGLATAYYLEKKAAAAGVSVSVTVVEAGPRPGGKIVTECERDFVVEGGPDSFVTDKPWGLALCHELGLADSLIPCNQNDNKVYILKNNALVPFPAGVRLTIPTRWWPFLRSPLISPAGKLRMAAEYFIPPRKNDEDESLADFIGRRFGREALETFGGPIMAGIFVSDPERMSMKGTFPAFLDMEKKHGSLIRAARRLKKRPPPPRTDLRPAGNAMFNSLRGGMMELVETLTAQLSADILCHTSVVGVERTGGVYRVRLSGPRDLLEADDLVLAVSASDAASLVSSLHPPLAEMLRAVRFVSTAAISLGYLREDMPTDRPLDGFGVLAPARENRNFIACTWSSTKFKHRAPRDCVLMRIFVGGYRNEELAAQDDAALIALARHELHVTMGIRADPVLVKLFRWHKGNPQYDVGHVDRVRKMEQLASAITGFHLAGSSYHGIGIPDCIKSGLGVAERIVAVHDT